MVFTNFNDKQIKNIIDSSWKNLGKNLYELSYLSKLIDEKNKIKIKGLDKLEIIKKDNIPVIFLVFTQAIGKFVYRY